ncbi:hypothetical protein RHMOL_Rhmol10G0189600 [Rhododendron molle]|uniref:Uncharacterized protein n=1 Tax=Rhododendron molle TaxID=49168 RepID=A0ACC0M502_RHOML|nr:hypothetical protein RHMOL_Rhmol10G0189600 [Rhododendron molle]
MHHRGRFSNGNKLTSQQEGIRQKEHQCLVEEDFRRDSAIAHGDPSTSARRLDDELTPQHRGIPWATHSGIWNQ